MLIYLHFAELMAKRLGSGPGKPQPQLRNARGNRTILRDPMKTLVAKLMSILLVLLGLALDHVGPAWAQEKSDLARMINTGYDLLERGQCDQAQQIYEELLRQHPDNPLALNNMGAIMVKKGDYEQALTYLNQALSRAKGHRVTLNRVCDVDGVCAALRMSEDPFEGEDLEWVIKSNILMVNMALTSGRNQRR
jgi:tetratricopeptide (TPR) repeat protein